ncbi:ester cyclase [Halomarina rubra]|uniref:Ester cyclase n=1 Tax=Halomarina rubra TaxID=2071873 RepID=A0ABD6AXE0_9EURY|nr:nuclear transport factor 2 family protein [Halomarina rubra]
MSTDTNLELLRESIAHHNDPETRDQYLDSYSEDLVLHGADADGLEELRAFYHTVWEAIPDLTVTIDNAVAEGDEVGARYSWSGTHAVTGEEVALDSGLTWYRFEDGKIVERWVAEGTGGAIRDIVTP